MDTVIFLSGMMLGFRIFFLFAVKHVFLIFTPREKQMEILLKQKEENETQLVCTFSVFHKHTLKTITSKRSLD